MMRYMMRDKSNGLGPVIVTEDELNEYIECNGEHEIVYEAIMADEQARIGCKPIYYRLPMGLDVYDLLTPEERVGFCKGNVLKYTIRAGKKPGNDIIRDLQKAKDNLEKWIEIEKERRDEKDT